MGPQLYRCGNLRVATIMTPSMAVLQWGRNFIVAEIAIPMKAAAATPSFNGAATLSLRKSVQVVCQATGRHSGFNGAATLSLRKCIRMRPMCLLSTGASMGPQLYRCGNAGGLRLPFLGRAASMGPQLYRCGNEKQHSDDLADVVHASMGPQLYRCGNERRMLEARRRLRASMGPQLYRCGNTHHSYLILHPA